MNYPKDDDKVKDYLVHRQKLNDTRYKDIGRRLSLIEKRMDGLEYNHVSSLVKKISKLEKTVAKIVSRI